MTAVDAVALDRSLRRARYARRLAAGVCVACGVPTQRWSRCLPCRRLNAARVARRRAAQTSGGAL